jgi:hypothetical protein
VGFLVFCGVCLSCACVFAAHVSIVCYAADMSADPNAHSAVQRALKSGRLVRPTACARCGAADSPLRDGRSGLHAHHADYGRPLDVEWLCVTCHLGMGGPSKRVHVVMSPEFLARIDAALGEGQSRGEFVRRAVERALGDATPPGPAEQPGRVERALDGEAPLPPGPAEPARPSQGARHDRDLMAPVLGVPVGVQARVATSAATKQYQAASAIAARKSGEAKRDVQPLSKPGKRS